MYQKHNHHKMIGREIIQVSTQTGKLRITKEKPRVSLPSIKETKEDKIIKIKIKKVQKDSAPPIEIGRGIKQV